MAMGMQNLQPYRGPDSSPRISNLWLAVAAGQSAYFHIHRFILQWLRFPAAAINPTLRGPGFSCSRLQVRANQQQAHRPASGSSMAWCFDSPVVSFVVMKEEETEQRPLPGAGNTADPGDTIELGFGYLMPF